MSEEEEETGGLTITLSGDTITNPVTLFDDEEEELDNTLTGPSVLDNTLIQLTSNTGPYTHTPTEAYVIDSAGDSSSGTDGPRIPNVPDNGMFKVIFFDATATGGYTQMLILYEDYQQNFEWTGVGDITMRWRPPAEEGAGLGSPVSTTLGDPTVVVLPEDPNDWAIDYPLDINPASRELKYSRASTPWHLYMLHTLAPETTSFTHIIHPTGDEWKNLANLEFNFYPIITSSSAASASGDPYIHTALI